MNKRGLYSKLGISVVGISLLMGVPTLIHANELNYGQLSISPIFQGGSYQLNNKSIDISPLLLDKLSGFLLHYFLPSFSHLLMIAK